MRGSECVAPGRGCVHTETCSSCSLTAPEETLHAVRPRSLKRRRVVSLRSSASLSFDYVTDVFFFKEALRVEGG